MEQRHHRRLTPKQTVKELKAKAQPGINLICFSHGAAELDQRGFVTLAHHLSKKHKIIYSSFNEVADDLFLEFSFDLQNSCKNIEVNDSWEYLEDNDPWEIRTDHFTRDADYIMIDDFHTFMNGENLSYQDRGIRIKELHKDLRKVNIKLLIMYSCPPEEYTKDYFSPIPKVRHINWCRQLKEVAETIFGGYANAFYQNHIEEFGEPKTYSKYDYTFQEIKCPMIF